MNNNLISIYNFMNNNYFMKEINHSSFFIIDSSNPSSNSLGPPIKPDAVLNRLIGLFPSVMINPLSPRASRSLAYCSGPALAI